MTATLPLPVDSVPVNGTPLPDGHDLVARYAIIAAALAADPSPIERAQLKEDIIALFREADAAAGAYAAFKASVKALATQWKHADPDAPAVTPTSANAPVSAPAAAPVSSYSTRVDHLGASTFVEKGWSKLSVGDAAGAEVALRRALELAPAENEAETLLGWALMLQQQYEPALVAFHNVLRRDPQHALARTNIGYICLRQRVYGEAIEHLSQAIRIDGDRKATMYAHLYLGMVYLEREMYDDAEGFFRRTLELGPNMLQAWYELGRARWFASRHDDARAAWRAGAEANKFNPWGKRCAEILAQVEQGGAPSRTD